MAEFKVTSKSPSSVANQLSKTALAYEESASNIANSFRG